jgi:NADH:ubiquinone oxidoreductase subunit 6 (subunit J)
VNTHAEKSPTGHGIAGAVGLVLSMLACYGTLAAIAVLSLLGVTFAPDETLVKVVIVAFALVSLFAMGSAIRRHGSALPLLIALAGTALLGYVMFADYSMVLEATAFALLAAAVIVDFRLCRRKRDGGRDVTA